MTTEAKKEVETFDGVTIVKSDTYKEYRDLLDAKLENGVEYSHDDIKKILDKELTRNVNVVRN